MATIYINGDAIYFTAPGGYGVSNGHSTTYGSASFGAFSVQWAGSNLGYTSGYILPTSGNLTFVSASKADGSLLYSAENFSLNLSGLPKLWSVDTVIFQSIAPTQANSIIGSSGGDVLVAVTSGDFLNGGQGDDTFLIFGNSTDWAVSVVSPVNSSGRATNKLNGNYIDFFSVEKIQFSDKTVNVSDYAASTISQTSNSLSVIVDKGIVDASAVYVEGFTEVYTYNGAILVSHTLKLGDIEFNYNDVDPLITTVVRNGNFTAEFQSEISDFIPSAAGISYADAVKLVGASNIEQTLVYVAGVDGNYVG